MEDLVGARHSAKYFTFTKQLHSQSDSVTFGYSFYSYFTYEKI